MIKYYASRANKNIVKLEVDVEGDIFYVQYGSFKTDKTNMGRGLYADTFKEAKEYLIINAEAELRASKEILQEIKALEEGDIT